MIRPESKFLKHQPDHDQDYENKWSTNLPMFTFVDSESASHRKLQLQCTKGQDQTKEKGKEEQKRGGKGGEASERHPRLHAEKKLHIQSLTGPLVLRIPDI